MPRKFWGIPRGKRSIDVVLTVLDYIKDDFVGRQWNRELQEEIDEILVTSDLKRERIKLDENPGNIRCNFTSFKAFGLIYLDFNNKICLTKVGEQMLDKKTPTQIVFLLLKKQVLNMQYPSPYFRRNNAKIIEDFQIKPFRFIVELLLESDIEYIDLEEAARFVIFAENHNQKDKIKNLIFEYRNSERKIILNKYFDYYSTRGINNYDGDLIEEEGEQISKLTDIDESKVLDILNDELELEFKYRPNSRWTANYGSRFDVVSTMKTQLIDIEIIKDENNVFKLKDEKEIKSLLDTPKFSKELIPFAGYPKNAETQEKKLIDLRFYNRYGKSWDSKMGITASDLNKEGVSPQKIKMKVIKNKYNDLVKKEAVTEMDKVVKIIKSRTQYSSADISQALKNVPQPDLNYFAEDFISLGGNGDKNLEFEKANSILFKKLGFETEHIGPHGRNPDVLVKRGGEIIGIIDAKATSNEYSITSGDERAVIEYINMYNKKEKLKFFLFSAGRTAAVSDSNIENIYKSTGVRGSIISSVLLTSILKEQLKAEKYLIKLEELFQLNREITVDDINIFLKEI